MIQFLCPSCAIPIKMKPHLAGQEAPCPACEELVRVPTHSLPVAVPRPRESGFHAPLPTAVAVVCAAVAFVLAEKMRPWRSPGTYLVLGGIAMGCGASLFLWTTVTAARSSGRWWSGLWRAFAGVSTLGLWMLFVLYKQTVDRVVVGRPLRVGGRARTAEPVGAHDWAAGSSPDLAGASAEELAARAAFWERTALEEHASIAAFGRLSLDLLAQGAPPELVDLAHQAARDEVRHAQLAFGLASAYAARAVGPGALVALRESPGRPPDLCELAVDSLRDGCLGEGFAAALALEAARSATDPALAHGLARIAADEARHAELGWKILEWAMARGGEPVRAALAEAFDPGATCGSGCGALLVAATALTPDAAGARARDLHREILHSVGARLAAAPDAAAPHQWRPPARDVTVVE